MGPVQMKPRVENSGPPGVASNVLARTAVDALAQEIRLTRRLVTGSVWPVESRE
jgi:hypothetical protein